MHSLIILSALCLTAGAGHIPQLRILDGSETTIQEYPYAAAVLTSSNQAGYTLACGGVILNERSVLSVAHCFYNSSPNVWRIRVGSSFVSTGGSVHNVASLISHPNFNDYFKENDIGIFRVSSRFNFDSNIQPGKFAGANYPIVDNLTVWTIGWGATSINGPLSNQLKHVEIQTVNQTTCRANYNIIAMTVTSSMMCAGKLNQNGYDPCTGDFGGPLLHNGVVIGISSWGSGCGYKNYPAVYTRVPIYIDWIQKNA